MTVIFLLDPFKMHTGAAHQRLTQAYVRPPANVVGTLTAAYCDSIRLNERPPWPSRAADIRSIRDPPSDADDAGGVWRLTVIEMNT